MLDIQVKYNKGSVEVQTDLFKKDLEEYVSDYKGLIVTEDNVADTKKIVAELNKMEKEIDNKRKEYKKELEKPIKELESKFKECSQILTDVIKPIKNQIDYFTELEKETKRQEVLDLIETLKLEIGRFEVVFKDSWLNKTTTMSSIEFDVRAELERQKMTKELIDEKREAIADYIKKLDKEKMAQAWLKVDFSKPLKDTFKMIDELNKVEEIYVDEVMEFFTEEKEEIEIPFCEEITYNVALELSLTDEQLKMLENYLWIEDITYRRIK